MSSLYLFLTRSLYSRRLPRFVKPSLIFVYVLLWIHSSFAQLTVTDPTVATSVANNWLRLGQEMNWGWVNLPEFSEKSAQEVTFNGELVGYCFSAKENGFIILPAFQELPPITVYSTTSSFDVEKEDGFCGMIKEVLESKISLGKSYLNTTSRGQDLNYIQTEIERNRSLWQNYSGSYASFTQTIQTDNQQNPQEIPQHRDRRYSIDDINPMLSTTWHQGSPYYNLCPMGDGSRTVVGCVATAMSQILAYWKYPTSGTGSHSYTWDGDQSCGGSTTGSTLSATFSDTYDWANILNDYSGSETQAQKDAVAELCYEAGIAVDMDYGACGSGAYTGDVVTVLPTYFGYASEIDREDRISYSTATSWFAMLQTELNYIRPMQYRISSHSIVCDGWRISGTNQIHLNYGWDDGYTAWYTVDNLYCNWSGCDPIVEYVIRKIHPSTIISIATPNGGDVLYTGQTQNITWSSYGISGNVKIELNRNYSGGTWETLFASTANDGTEAWTVSGVVSSNARIRISSVSVPSVLDVSNANFSIVAPTITLTSPNGGETWWTGDANTITWTSTGLSENVKIELNRSYPGSTWEILLASTANDGSEAWTVTGPICSTARLRITGVMQTTVGDSANANFTISQRSIAVTAPNGAEAWIGGDTNNITWSSAGLSSETVKIELNRSYPGSTWETLFTSATNDGTEPWVVTGTASTSARVRISGNTHTSVVDTSNANFTIGLRSITLTSPNGGESWITGTSQAITWNSTYLTGNVKIELNRYYSAGLWETLSASTLNTGMFYWTVTDPATTQNRIRVTSINSPATADTSGNNFTIRIPNQPPVLMHDALHDQITYTFTVTAIVRDDASGFTTRFFYKPTSGSVYDSLLMTATTNPDEYAVTIGQMAIGSHDYYILTRDIEGLTASTTRFAFIYAPTYCLGTVQAYDDGTSERSNWSSTYGYKWAVRFSNTGSSYLLYRAQIGISCNSPDTVHTPIQVQVMLADGIGGMPGTVLQTRIAGSVGNEVGGLRYPPTNWDEVVIRDASGNPLQITGDFYIAVSNPDSTKSESFLQDTSSTYAGHSYVYNPCDAKWYAENSGDTCARLGNRMIRIQGLPLIAPTAVIQRSGNNILLNWNDTGAPLYRIYSAATADGPFTTVEGTSTGTSFTDVGAITASSTLFYQVRASTP